jgi:hypothetical protein
MKKKLLFFLMVVGFFPVQIFAWQGIPTPMLHVEGRYLKNPDGENVSLRGGWMQPTETWFNGGGKWYSNPTDWTNPSNVAGMLNFLNDAATLMSDISPRYGTNHGWYCTFVRVNTDAIGGWTQESGLVDQAQFNGWIQNFIVPYANHLRSRGLYLILSATGPINTPNNGSNNAGVTEQARLRTFWSTVANAPGVKNADNIMFELMNEPVAIESYPGNGDWGFGSSTYWRALRDWMQPVINDIRNTGANNVIWVPTLGWQGEPQGWVEYPFSGSDVGIAAHYYPAYGGCGDNASCHNSLWNNNYKPATDRWPMIITENFWFPEDNGLCHGSTAIYGNTLKANIDAAGNVSYMIGFLGDLLDDLNNALPVNCNLSSKEGAQAAFEWWYQYNGGGCTPTSVTPYVQVNDGAWQQTASVTVDAGAKIVFGPQPVSGGSWSWSGCGTSGTSREQTIYPTVSCTSTATYTNTCGAQSTQDFTVNVNGSSSYVSIQNKATALMIDGMGSTSNGSVCSQSGNSGSENQQWTIETSGSYVRIKNRATGLYIDGMGSTANGSAADQWGDSNSDNQQWAQETTGSYVKFKNRATGLYLDGLGRTSNGSELGQWQSSSSDNQQWILVGMKSTIMSDEATSVKESLAGSVAYPNPVTSVLDLQLTAPAKEIVVYSIEGKQLYSQNTVSENVEIDMSGFNPGIYFVKATGQNETWTQKIMKQ